MIEGCDERVTIISEAQMVKARKAHGCKECGRTINKGEKYLREVFKFDGALTTHKTCEHCEMVRRWLVYECGGWVYGAIAEDIREHFQEGYGFGIGRLAVGIGRNWKRYDGTLMPIPVLPANSN